VGNNFLFNRNRENPAVVERNNMYQVSSNAMIIIVATMASS
jgi:hypothetical protein